MQLVFESKRARWEAVTEYGEPAAQAAKASGFVWDRSVSRWHSSNALAALRIREYADEATQARLDVAVEQARVAQEAKAAKEREAVEASRATTADIEIPCAAGRTFLPYQKAGIAFALARQNVLFGDDMGLGKTGQAVGVINVDESLKRILIVCPASLTRNWIREFGFFGTRPLSIGIATTKKVPDTDVVICTYDVFSRDTTASNVLLSTTWDALVLDEAHYLKNHDAKRTKAILGARGFPGLRARRRLYLTGTPITNRPIELWPLIHSLAPVEFGNKLEFAKRYCNAHQGGFGWDFSGSSNLDELQDRLRATIMVRRLKVDVLTELPEKRRQIIEMPADTPALRAVLKLEADADAEHEAAKALLARYRHDGPTTSTAEYNRAVLELAASVQVAFTRMSAVRHDTAVAKAPVVAQHIRDAVDSGVGKVIVFAHHKDVVDILTTELADLGVVSITGSTPPALRQGIVDKFQTDAAVQVFVGNIAAAGVGITLTASSFVVFAELDWVPGNVSQAEDRAYRLGQKNSVLVQHLVLEGSLDAKMARTIVEKQEVIDAAMDDMEADEAREARIAAVQAEADARAADAVAAAQKAEAEHAAAVAAHEEAQEAKRVRAAERAAEAVELAKQQAAERGSRLASSIAAAAASIGASEVPGMEATAAIRLCLQLLADLDPDGATEVNGAGFNKVDSYHGHYLARLPMLSEVDAIVGRELVRRYQRQLEEGLVAKALGEPVKLQATKVERVPEVVAVEPEQAEQQPETLAGTPVTMVTDILAILDNAANDDGTPALFVDAEPAVVEIKRGRGRQPTGVPVMSQAERNKRWRASKAVVAVEVTSSVAERMRGMRDASGMTTSELLAAALDALESAQKSKAA